MSAVAPQRTAGEFGPWNPGITSQVPWQLLPLSTLFRPENVFTSIERARDMRDLTGLDLDELVAFRPQRLVLHELLIRIMADLSVPDGPRVEDLGINFRRMVRTILTGYIEPHMADIVAAYDATRQSLAAVIAAELETLLRPPPPAAPTAPGLAQRVLQRVLRRPAATGEAPAQPVPRMPACSDAVKEAGHQALQRVTAVMLSRHGRLWGGEGAIVSLATDMACNEYGGDEIGRLIEPMLEEAARREGYRRLPAQARPIVLNTKGASASGKSTLRPLQKLLAERIGASWEDFAVISPDIWRKQLLDYATLGPAYKYAGSFTGHELRIIDLKLDRYMARKAEARGISHLLIDRFRFDSFAPDSDEAGKGLLTRFGQLVYLFFMVTPPAETVERAWLRGLEVGRYKAVDDLLAHNVEAYSGMPGLFFTWIRRQDKQVHFEFLDNGVSLGERPRTIAFGLNGEMNILDVKSMIDAERYRRIDVNATRPEALYREGEALAPERNADFLSQCVRRLRVVNFADQESGRIYLRVVAGNGDWADPGGLAAALQDPDRRAGILAAVPDALRLPPPPGGAAPSLPEALEPGTIHTLGRWGNR